MATTRQTLLPRPDPGKLRRDRSKSTNIEPILQITTPTPRKWLLNHREGMLKVLGKTFTRKLIRIKSVRSRKISRKINYNLKSTTLLRSLSTSALRPKQRGCPLKGLETLRSLSGASRLVWRDSSPLRMSPQRTSTRQMLTPR